MSDTEKRDAVVERFYAQHYGTMMGAAVLDVLVTNAMADRIVELEAAVERVRALHQPPRSLQDSRWTESSDTGLLMSACNECGDDYPCPTLRALEGMP